MAEYRVNFSARFDADIIEIESQAAVWGARQTDDYIESLLGWCLSLTHFPERFAETQIGERRYRTFVFKAHRVFYRIEGDQVLVIAVLSVRQKPENWIT